MATPEELEQWAAKLDASADYRVLRRLRIPEPEHPSDLLPGERIAVIIDTETTGLDHRSDEVIEIGMISVAYNPNGDFRRVLAIYSALNAPTAKLSKEITRLTGLDDATLAGKAFNICEIDRFIEPAALIIAHNAAFDRPFCEKIAKSFTTKAWACSATEVPWRRIGYEGLKLTYLLNQSGYFDSGHRALNDSAAVLTILSTPTRSNDVPSRMLLASAREKRALIRLSGSYDARQALRARGYRWNGSKGSRLPSWALEVAEADLPQELDVLEALIPSTAGSVSVEHQTAYDRYREG